jgi:hypothetical protein
MEVKVSRALRAGGAGLLMLALSAASTGATVRQAEAQRAAQADTTLSSGIKVQNLSDSTANIQISMVKSDGTLPIPAVTDTIPARGAKSYYLPSHASFASLPDGFSGAALIDSDQPVAAAVNISNTGGTSSSDPYRLTTYTGFSPTDTAQTVYLPEVTRYGGYNSTVHVQNAGSADTTATITYLSTSGSTVSSPGCTTSQTVKANASVQFRQSDCTGLGSTFNGAAVVTATNSTDKLAAIAVKTNSFSTASDSQFLVYSGSISGGTKLYVPKVVNGYAGFDGGISIQNVSASTATVTVDFTFGSSTKRKTLTIAPQASASLFAPTAVMDDGTMLATGPGSAVINSTANVVAVVNERNDSVGFADTYRAPVDGTQTAYLSMAQVSAKYYGFTSGLAIQNAGTTAMTCQIVLTPSSGSAQTFNTSSVAVGALSQQLLSNLWPTADFDGSARVTCTQPAFAIVNHAYLSSIDSRYGEKYGDSESIYNALNLSS